MRDKRDTALLGDEDVAETEANTDKNKQTNKQTNQYENGQWLLV